VDGYFLRSVLFSHITGAGLQGTNPLVMNPSDWRFLFQVVMLRDMSDMRDNKRPSIFTGSLRETANSLGLSHTALSQQLRRIESWKTMHTESSPLYLKVCVDAQRSRNEVTRLVVSINTKWFKTQGSKRWRKPTTTQHEKAGAELRPLTTLKINPDQLLLRP
jgi:hypothetical protein